MSQNVRNVLKNSKIAKSRFDFQICLSPGKRLSPGKCPSPGFLLSPAPPPPRGGGGGLDVFLDLVKFERPNRDFALFQLSIHLAHFVLFRKKTLKVQGNAFTFHSETRNMQKCLFFAKRLLFLVWGGLGHFLRFSEKYHAFHRKRKSA